MRNIAHRPPVRYGLFDLPLFDWSASRVGAVYRWWPVGASTHRFAARQSPMYTPNLLALVRRRGDEPDHFPLHLRPYRRR